MKDIKDYLHLYFYSEIEITEVFINVGYKVGQRFTPTGGEIHLALRENPVFSCKPILRRLSDMSEEDSRKIFGTKTKHLFYKKEEERDPAGLFLFTPNEFKKLCEESFDPFGLIDAGLAIDAKTLTN